MAVMDLSHLQVLWAWQEILPHSMTTTHIFLAEELNPKQFHNTSARLCFFYSYLDFVALFTRIGLKSYISISFSDYNS